MLRKVLWILMLIFLVQMQETEQKALNRRHKNGKRSQGYMFRKHTRPFLSRQTAVIIEEPQAEELYAFNKPIGFVDKKYQPVARTAVKAEEIYAEDFRIKNPVIIKDITLKYDSSLTSALENELSIRKLMEELIAKSQLLNAEVGKEAVATAIKEESLKKLHSAENTSGKVVLKEGTKQQISSAALEFGNQTILNNVENQMDVNGTKTKTGSETLNKEFVQAIANPATDSNGKILLEEKFKKAIMQHYWQHILEKAKDMEKKNQTKAEEVSINLKNELEKSVKEISKNATAFTVGILASADNHTLVEDSSIGGSEENFQAEVVKDTNNETLINVIISNINPVESENTTENLNAKEYEVEESSSLSPMEKQKQTLTKSVVADMKSNMSEPLETLKNSNDLKAEKPDLQENIAIAVKDLIAYQEDNIDIDDFLIANIDDGIIENNNVDQIYDIQDRSNAIVRILHKDNLQKVSKDENKSSPFNLTSIKSEPHPEDIVATHLDDDTLKNQLDFLQNNAPKIKKHKEVLSDKNGLLEVGVLTKNDTELEADYEKAVQEQIHKIGQNVKTAFDFSKVLVNTSSVDSVEVLPLQQMDFYNEDVTLELPQYIHFYGEDIDILENIEGSLTLQQPEHIQAAVLKPVLDVAHIEHTTEANWSTNKVSIENVTNPTTSLKTPAPLTSWMTEKTVETIAMLSTEDLNVKETSTVISIGDETKSATYETTTEQTKTASNFLENSKIVENSTVFAESTTLKADILKKNDVEKTTVYQEKIEYNSEKTTEVPKKDHIEIPTETLINHETTTEMPILKAEDLTKIKIMDAFNQTKIPPVLEASKFAVDKIFNKSEEYLKVPIAANANKTATFATEEENKDQLKTAGLLTTTVRSQFHELKDESLSIEQFSKLKLDTTTSRTDNLANGNLKFNPAESGILKREELEKKIGQNAEKIIKHEEDLLEKETENDYVKLKQPTKAEKVKPVEKEKVNAAEEEIHNVHEKLKDNLSVMFEELVQEKPTTVQAETMTKVPPAGVEHEVTLEATTKQTELSNLQELANKLENNATTKIFEESSVEDNIQVNGGETEVQGNEEIKKVSSAAGSDKLQKAELEESITAGNYKFKEKNSDDKSLLANEKLESEKIEKATAEENDKLGKTTTEASLVVDNDVEKEVKLDEAMLVDNDEEKDEEISESSAEYGTDESEEDMNETSAVNNDWQREETIDEISAEDNENIEENSSELSAVDSEEDTKESTEDPIELGDASIRGGMIQETAAEDDAVTEETFAEDNGLEEEDIIGGPSVNDEDHVAYELLKEIKAKDKDHKKDEMTMETSVEDNDRKKVEMTVESLTAESDKVKEEDSEKATPEDNEKIINEKLAIDKNHMKKVEKIAIGENDRLREENTTQLTTANNYKNKINENIFEETSAADYVKVKADKNGGLKYGIKAAIKNSNKLAVDTVQIENKIMNEISAGDNNGVNEENFGESLTTNNGEDNAKVKEQISVKTTDNNGTKDENNEEVITDVANDNAKEEETYVAAAELTDEVVEGKIKEDMTEEMSTKDSDETKENAAEVSSAPINDKNINIKDTIAEATSLIDVVKMKADKIEDSTAAHRNKGIEEDAQKMSSEDKTKVESKKKEQNNGKETFSISSPLRENNKVEEENIEHSALVNHDKSKEIATEELKSDKQNKTAVDVNRIKEVTIKETATGENNVKVRVEELTTGSPTKEREKLYAIYEKESTVEDSEESKTERTVPTKPLESDRTQAVLSAISTDNIKANSSKHDGKAKEGVVKILVEQHKVKEAVNEKTANDSFKKPNTLRMRKIPKRPVIKNSTQKNEVDKIKKSTSVKDKNPVFKNVTQAVAQNTKMQGEDRPTKVNTAQLVNIDKNKKILENLKKNMKTGIENIQMNKNINISESDAAEINENTESDKYADTQQIVEHIPLEKVEEFLKITKTKNPQGEFEQSVKIDKAVLKQIELNVAKKQNATDAKQNIADGNNKLRIILSSKQNPSSTTKVENNSKTNYQMKNQTKNGQFIETKQNNDEVKDESLSKTKTNKTKDSSTAEKKNQLQINDNNSIEIQKLNEDVSSTVNCVTTKAESAAAGTTDSKDIDDTDKNNQENSKSFDDIKTRAIKRIGTVLTEQQVEDENNKSIEKESNDENNKNATAAADKVDHSNSVDVDVFADGDDDEMTTLRPIALTWQQDNSSITQSKEYEEDEEEQQALESDEVDSYIDDDIAAENNAEIENQQIENTEDDKYADKSQEFKNNASNEEQLKYDNVADSKINDRIKQQADTFVDNNGNVVTEKIINDNTLQITKNQGNRKISSRYETTPMPIEITAAAVDDDYNNTNDVADVDNVDDVAAVGFADTTQYHANKQIENIAAPEQQQPVSNWWSTLHHAEIRKFLNSIFNDAADEFYQEIARQARVELQEIPQQHSVVNDNRRKGSATHWLNNVWSLW